MSPFITLIISIYHSVLLRLIYMQQMMLLNMPANLENSAVVTGLEKVTFHSILKEGNTKECSNYLLTVLISHASRVMLKILQARLQYYVNQELPDVQTGFREGRGSRDQIANICWIIEKARALKKRKKKKKNLLH